MLFCFNHAENFALFVIFIIVHQHAMHAEWDSALANPYVSLVCLIMVLYLNECTYQQNLSTIYG